jgi:hypothetical protein
MCVKRNCRDTMMEARKRKKRRGEAQLACGGNMAMVPYM